MITEVFTGQFYNYKEGYQWLLTMDVQEQQIEVMPEELVEEGCGELLQEDLVPPALPPDKSYHALISFHSQDRYWVRRILAAMEAPPYNFKCCYADRDFHPGKDVLHNIELCMELSTNVILILSPEHLESHYCDFETSLAMEMAHEKKGKVIPVLRRGDHMPSSLRFINYIDGRDGVEDADVVRKLAKGIIEGMDKRLPHHNVNGNQFKNGDEVRWEANYVENWKKGPGLILPDLTDTLIQDCQILGIQMLPCIWQAIQVLLSGSAYFRHHWSLYTHCGRFVVIMVAFLVICVNVVEILELIDWIYADIYTESFLPLGIVFVLAVSLLIVPLIVIPNKMVRYSVNSLCGQISYFTLAQKLLVYIGKENGIVSARLMKYDLQPCVVFIRAMISALDVNSSIAEDNLQKMTDATLKMAVPQYVKMLSSTAVMFAPRTRHHVRRDLVCMCQFIEAKKIHNQATEVFHREPVNWNFSGLARGWHRLRNVVAVRELSPLDADDRQTLVQNNDIV